MSRDRMLILFGILILISPFVGLPLVILSWVLPVLGALVLGIGASYTVRRRMEREQGMRVPELTQQM